MDQHRFFNACLSLMNIDMHDLVEAGIIAPGNVDLGGSSWRRFTDEPLVFLAKIDDAKRDALWRILEQRQRRADPKQKLLDALNEAIAAWPQYDREGDGELNISGADLVDWFGEWRARAIELVARRDGYPVAKAAEVDPDGAFERAYAEAAGVEKGDR